MFCSDSAPYSLPLPLLSEAVTGRTPPHLNPGGILCNLYALLAIRTVGAKITLGTVFALVLLSSLPLIQGHMGMGWVKISVPSPLSWNSHVDMPTQAAKRGTHLETVSPVSQPVWLLLGLPHRPVFVLGFGLGLYLYYF